MARTLRIDKSLGLITIELDKTEPKRILDSIDLMVQERKRNLFNDKEIIYIKRLHDILFLELMYLVISLILS